MIFFLVTRRHDTITRFESSFEKFLLLFAFVFETMFSNVCEIIDFSMLFVCQTHVLTVLSHIFDVLVLIIITENKKNQTSHGCDTNRCVAKKI